MTYNEIMENQTKKLVDSIINDQDYEGFHIYW